MALDKQLAFLDPSAVFATPEEVRDHKELTSAEKIDVLKRWAYDVSEMAVAVEEGMPDANRNNLQQILRILAELGGDSDLEHTGPSKQHGLPPRR